MQIAPKEDELKLFQTYRGSLQELSPPERFLASMATVPRLTTKINLLILIQQFDVRPPPSLILLPLSLHLHQAAAILQNDDALHQARF